MAAKENQDATMYAGDTRSLRFPLEDAGGAAAVLAAPSGVWNLAPGVKTDPEAVHVLTKTPRLVQETISAVLWWVAYVDLVEDDTKSIPGTYTHQLRIIDGGSKLITAAGKLTIKRKIS